MIKKTILSGRIDDGSEDDKLSLLRSVELRPDLGEKKSSYYAVCTNFWGDQKTATITLCTFAEPLGDFESYSEAKEAVDRSYNGKKKCPYCGFTHFRASAYDDLIFDNEYADLYFNITE